MWDRVKMNIDDTGMIIHVYIDSIIQHFTIKAIVVKQRWVDVNYGLDGYNSVRQ